MEILDGLFVAGANDNQVGGEDSLGRAGVEVSLEITTQTANGLARLLEPVEKLQDLLEGGCCDLLLVGQGDELQFLGSERDQDAVELNVVVDILLALLSLDLIERWLGDVDVTAADELRHLVVEEGKEQGPDVGSIDVGICHDDDASVAELLNVEGSFLITITDACSDRGDHGLDLGVLEDLVETGLLHIDQLASDREDCLEAAVAALLGGATCGVTLDDIELGERGIALGAVGQFAG